MLALSRKKNEAIIINNNVEVTILEVKGDQVKVGITAPKDVPIYRKEVYLQIQEANKEAVSADGMEALKTLLGSDSPRLLPERACCPAPAWMPDGTNGEGSVTNRKIFLGYAVNFRKRNSDKSSKKSYCERRIIM